MMKKLQSSCKVIQLHINTINTVMQKYTQVCMILDYSDLVKCGYNKTDKKNFSDKEIFFSLVIKYLGETMQTVLNQGQYGNFLVGL